MTDLTKQVFDTIGDKAMVIAMEELAELQQAISKGIRGKLDKDNLAEELADVYIVLQWISDYFKVYDKEVIKWEDFKLNRIKTRLESGEFK